MGRRVATNAKAEIAHAFQQRIHSGAILSHISGITKYARFGPLLIYRGRCEVYFSTRLVGDTILGFRKHKGAPLVGGCSYPTGRCSSGDTSWSRAHLRWREFRRGGSFQPIIRNALRPPDAKPTVRSVWRRYRFPARCATVGGRGAHRLSYNAIICIAMRRIPALAQRVLRG